MCSIRSIRLVMFLCLLLVPVVSLAQEPIVSDYQVLYFDIPDPFHTPGLTSLESINEWNDIAGHWIIVDSGPRGFMRQAALQQVPVLCATDAFRTLVAGINNRQETVGLCLNPILGESGFLHRNGGLSQLLRFPNSDLTTASGINDNRLVVGSFVDRVTGRRRGYYFVNGRYTETNPPWTTPELSVLLSAVNNQDHVVGFTGDITGIHGVLRLPGGIWSALDFPGAQSTIPADINQQGDIVGVYATEEAGVQSFIKDALGWRTFDVTLPGAALVQLTGVNDRGWLVGRVALPSEQRDVTWYWQGFLAIPLPPLTPAAPLAQGAPQGRARTTLAQETSRTPPRSNGVRLVQAGEACAGATLDAGTKLRGIGFCLP